MNIKQLLIATILLLSSAAYGQTDSDVEDIRRMAEQGDVDAQTTLGILYDYGNSVPENDAEAVKWYRLAAEQGNALAQSNLGSKYARGEGVPENYLTAYVWMSVSAAQGNQLAKGNIDMVKNKLTNEQVAQGQTLAATCFESDYQDCE